MNKISQLLASKTIWGAIISLASVASMLLGVDISAELINEIQTSLQGIVSAVGILIGTVTTIIGRIKAKGPIE